MSNYNIINGNSNNNIPNNSITKRYKLPSITISSIQQINPHYNRYNKDFAISIPSSNTNNINIFNNTSEKCNYSRINLKTPLNIRRKLNNKLESIDPVINTNVIYVQSDDSLDNSPLLSPIDNSFDSLFDRSVDSHSKNIDKNLSSKLTLLLSPITSNSSFIDASSPHYNNYHSNDNIYLVENHAIVNQSFTTRRLSDFNELTNKIENKLNYNRYLEEINGNESITSELSNLSFDQMNDLQSVYTNYTGNKAIETFNNKYKQSNRLLYIYSNSKDSPAELHTPRSKYLHDITKNNLLPIALLIRQSNQLKGIYLNNKGFGDRYIEPLVKVIDQLPLIETLDLQDNRLTDQTFSLLFHKLNDMKYLTYIDISYNKLSISSIDLMDYINNTCCICKVLLLDYCNINDRDGKYILYSFIQNQSLQLISLANNCIGNSELYIDTNSTNRLAIQRLNSNKHTTRLSSKLSTDSSNQSISRSNSSSISRSSSRSKKISTNRIKNQTTNQSNKKLLNLINNLTIGQIIEKIFKTNHMIEKINFRWNFLRLNNAIDICKSIEYCHLKILDLSNNALDNISSQYLGKSLKNNKSIISLNIAYNSITPKATVVIAYGLCYNQTIRKLVIDGNQIGRSGSQALIAAIQRSVDNCTDERHRLRIFMNDCDCINDVEGLFDANNPGGLYSVDLEEPYGRMVVDECLFLADHKAGCKVKRFEIDGSIIELVPYINPNNQLTREDINNHIKACSNMLLSNDLNQSYRNLHIILKQFNLQINESLSKECLLLVKDKWMNDHKANSESQVANEFNIPDDEELSDVLLYEYFQSYYDIASNNKSYIYKNDFHNIIKSLDNKSIDDKSISKLFNQYIDSTNNNNYIMTNSEFSNVIIHNYCVIKESNKRLVNKLTNQRYILPYHGKCNIELEFNYEIPKLNQISKNVSIEHIIELIYETKSDELKNIMLLSLMNSPYYYLTHSQSQIIFNEVKSHLNMNLFDIISCIIPQIIHYNDTVQFLNNNLNLLGKFALRVKLGYLYNIYIGIPTGHYSFNLSNTDHIRGCIRLSALMSNEIIENSYINLDTSQKGNYSNFRNEKLNNQPVSLIQSWFTTNRPTNGVLKCDYISTYRPNVSIRPMDNNKFIELCNNYTLDDIFIVMNHYKQLSNDSIKSLNTNTTNKRISYTNSQSFKSNSLSNNSSEDMNDDIPNDKSINQTADNVTKSLPEQIFPPLTISHVKEQYIEYINTSHLYWDIYPHERVIDNINKDNDNKVISNNKYKDREKPKSLDELRGIPNPVPPKPSMPPFYPIAYRKLLELQVLLPSIYLSVDQVIRLLKCFPIEGYLRVQVFQSVFSHIVDLKNIYLIIEELFTLDEYEEACHRMGILNLFDPMRVDRFYALDLRRREYREWCKILIQLAIVEPGENWVDESYRYGRYDDPISGWILPNTWTQPDSDNYGEGGPRHFGWLTLTYRSEGFGCAPNIPLRQQLRKKTLIGFKRII